MRRDLYIGIVLVAFGLLVLVESLRMPDLAHLGVNPYTVPGIVPGFLGAVIALLGGIMLSRSVIGLRLRKEARTGAPNAPADETDGEAEQQSLARVLLTLVLTVGYAVILVDTLPFWLATFIFVMLFLLVFEWRPDRPPRAYVGYLGGALLLSGLVAAGVTFLFEQVFLVRLP